MSATAYEKQKPTEKSGRRSFSGRLKVFITVLTLVLAIFHLYTAFFGLMPAMQQRSFHICFVLVLIFLLFPAGKGSPQSTPSWLDWILASLALVCSLYIFFNYPAIAGRAGMYLEYELYLGAIMTVLVFEAGRRVLGYPLPIFCSLFLFFAYYGRSMPGPLKHFGLSIPRILEELYLTTDGLFGLVAGVSATYIFLFVLFGAFLKSTGTSVFFNDLAMALAGHQKGGPAKIAVLSSALMGTISGSTSANVATTGAFTIPLMKKIGYRAHYAGAVEAVASTGGQIMPPVMGAAAFIIADALGVKYINVLMAALVPALLYFWGVWCCLSLEAHKLGLEGLAKSELPKLKTVLLTSGYKAIPLLVIIYILVKGYNPLYAGVWGIITASGLSFVRKEERLNLRELVQTLENGTKTALPVAIACTIVGIVIGMMGATGVALKIGDAVLMLTQGNLFPTLLITMVISLLLGMGMPTTASYVMASAVAAPALVLLGTKALDAHLFVFYFAVLSTLTPPVCVGCYTAAGLAGANLNRTAVAAIKLALAGFIIPYIFIYSPDLLLTNVQNWGRFVLTFATAAIGVFGLSLASEGYFRGYLNMLFRFVALCSALALIYPGVTTDLAGFALLGAVIAYQFVRSSSAKVASGTDADQVEPAHTMKEDQ
ncbi:MAG: TRAP transporter permease [Synergistales bacterium]|nr:TRAP transporter permease [Synergistales bacterium]